MEVHGRIDWFKTRREADARAKQLRQAGFRAFVLDMGDHITLITKPAPPASAREKKRSLTTLRRITKALRLKVARLLRRQ